MLGSLDVLVVDDRPDSIRFLTEFLVQRCRRVDVTTSVKDALLAITRRRNAKEPYGLVISDFAMPEADGLSLLRDLRLRQDDTTFVFVTGYRALNPDFEPEAKRLGTLAILDKPVDLRRLEEVVTQTTAIIRRRQEASQADQPFFGTSRTIRRSTETSATPSNPSTALEPIAGRSPDPPPIRPMTATWRNPDPTALEPVRPPTPVPAPAPITGYQRRPSAIIPTGGTTSRIRRSTTPGAPTSTGTGRLSRGTPQPPTSSTGRVRRGVEGSGPFARHGGEPVPQREVCCGSCGATFLAARKPIAYTTVCVHCGQLQRIEPE